MVSSNGVGVYGVLYGLIFSVLLEIRRVCRAYCLYGVVDF